MKSLILFSTLFSSLSYGQTIYTFCFDQADNCYPYINQFDPILTLNGSFPGNIWQIGTPQKTIFNSSLSGNRAILTDSINHYPTSTVSEFIITQQSTANYGVEYANFYLVIDYLVDSDTLDDFGSIEFSMDNGSTWFDLINSATSNGWEVQHPGLLLDVPVLSGSSGAWVHASFDHNTIPGISSLLAGDILKWRFTFTSDANQTFRDGLMYDDITIVITPPIGIQEIKNESLKEISGITDLSGRKCSGNEPGLLIIHYQDGSTRKMFNLSE